MQRTEGDEISLQPEGSQQVSREGQEEDRGRRPPCTRREHGAQEHTGKAPPECRGSSQGWALSNVPRCETLRHLQGRTRKQEGLQPNDLKLPGREKTLEQGTAQPRDQQPEQARRAPCVCGRGSGTGVLAAAQGPGFLICSAGTATLASALPPVPLGNQQTTAGEARSPTPVAPSLRPLHLPGPGRRAAKGRRGDRSRSPAAIPIRSGGENSFSPVMPAFILWSRERVQTPRII